MSNKYHIPDNYVRKKYRKDFLKKVICRIDFDTPIKIENIGPPKEIYELVKARFPIAETMELIGKEFQIGPGPIKESISKKREWFYHGKDREKFLKVTPDFILIEYSKYDYFEKLQEDFISAVDALFKSFPSIKIKRLGLRYIDSINLDGDPFDWKDYLTDSLIKNLEIASDKRTLSRVFNLLEFNYGDTFLRFQYGLFNDDHPAQIKKRNFLLDYDMFSTEIMDKQELAPRLEEFHKKLGASFEEVITDKLRNLMEPVHEG